MYVYVIMCMYNLITIYMYVYLIRICLKMEHCTSTYM